MMLLLLACAAEPMGAESAEVPEVAEAAEVLPDTPPPRLADAVGKPVSLQARDVTVLADGAEVRVPWLDATLVPVGDYVDLDRPSSFRLDLQAMEVRIPEQSVQAAINGRTPFRDVTIHTDPGEVRLTGHARFLSLPFDFKVSPRATPAGALALELEQVNVLGIRAKAFVAAFARPIERAGDKAQRHLVDVRDDELVIDPFPAVGPPRIQARFTEVVATDDALVARLGSPVPVNDAGSGLTLAGGALMADGTLYFDTTIRLVGMDGAPLVIDPPVFARQQERGFVRQLPGRAVTVYVAPPEATND